ncbi:ribulose-phosphate 3-epimerase (plasmid) [Allomeiothermus silvanus DSM 9946]|uniref:Phosphoribulokinase n=1 Tax=Allomeiothermus silvanus (strain ATCC 700542 / DSM 9946 / NBRC 106475 / NCIMB 13440 / VI-R2) TaxID=526227 RepID=D7BIR2_ALLS1|nr:phosphoribulokinase [Allomeiothermus silvanus]ADH65068.1 ribulose-phosphate 3-epimerase [Allomeiothermus silvanus DSM 9946]
MPHRPFMLGLAGDSGAGKTTISTGIARLMGQERTTNICVDDYHKYDRKQRAERNITPLNPACNHMDILEQHVRLLAMGEPILKPIYNHSTGTFDPPVYVPPPRAVSDGNRMIPRVVVLEGLLTLFSPAMRERYHLKVYVDPEEELRREWKIKRDVAKRGYTPEQVVADIERRMPDSQAYIWPQKEHADIVVRFYRPLGYDPERPGTLSVRIKLKHSLPRLDLTEVLHSAYEDEPTVLRLETRKEADILDISGGLSPEKAAVFERLIWEQLGPHAEHFNPELIGTFWDKGGHSYPLALSQLIIAYYLVHMREQAVQHGVLSYA